MISVFVAALTALSAMTPSAHAGIDTADLLVKNKKNQMCQFSFVHQKADKGKNHSDAQWYTAHNGTGGMLTFPYEGDMQAAPGGKENCYIKIVQSGSHGSHGGHTRRILETEKFSCQMGQRKILMVCGPSGNFTVTGY